jgi:hypothetical protein
VFKVYSIAKIAEITGKSKTAIYERLNNNKDIFKKHISKKDNVKYLSKEGLNILSSMFDNTFQGESIENKLNHNIEGKAQNADIFLYEKLLESFEEQKKMLESKIELVEKESNKKIEMLENQIENQKSNYENRLIEQKEGFKETTKTLERELEEKNSQILKYSKLLENSQVLLKEEQNIVKQIEEKKDSWFENIKKKFSKDKK